MSALRISFSLYWNCFGSPEVTPTTPIIFASTSMWPRCSNNTFQSLNSLQRGEVASSTYSKKRSSVVDLNHFTSQLWLLLNLCAQSLPVTWSKKQPLPIVLSSSAVTTTAAQHLSSEKESKLYKITQVKAYPRTCNH